MIRILSKITSLVPSWIWLLLCLMLSAAWGLSSLEVFTLKSRLDAASERIAAVTAQKDLEIQSILTLAAEQRAEDEAKARDREQELASHYANLERVKNDQINRLRADVRSLRYGLRDLPSRPSFGLVAATSSEGVSTAPDQSIAIGCPAPVIYREDGEFLVDEAERAETIRLELLKLYDLLDKASELKQ